MYGFALVRMTILYQIRQCHSFQVVNLATSWWVKCAGNALRTVKIHNPYQPLAHAKASLSQWLNQIQPPRALAQVCLSSTWCKLCCSIISFNHQIALWTGSLRDHLLWCVRCVLPVVNVQRVRMSRIACVWLAMKLNHRCALVSIVPLDKLVFKYKYI